MPPDSELVGKAAQNAIQKASVPKLQHLNHNTLQRSNFTTKAMNLVRKVLRRLSRI